MTGSPAKDAGQMSQGLSCEKTAEGAEKGAEGPELKRWLDQVTPASPRQPPGTCQASTCELLSGDSLWLMLPESQSMN